MKNISQKQRMLQGLMYSPNGDAELQRERMRAKAMCQAYNRMYAVKIREEEENEIICRLLGHTGKKFEIVAPFWCDYGYNIEIGSNFFANHNTVILDCARVTFGDNVFIGPNCGFYTAGHPLDVEQRRAGWEYARPITVGNDVWIGGGVHVMPGVTIGNGAVIGGGSVVTKDIPAHVLAVGNPCRIVREIGEDDCSADLIL